MEVKHFSILILFSLITNKMVGQIIPEDEIFRQDSVGYDVVLATRDLMTKSKKQNPGYFIVMNMPKGLKKSILKKELSYWKNKLLDSATSWRANLILYYVYQREAMLIAAIKIGLTTWPQVRGKEIEYWEEYLGKKRDL